MQLFYDPDAAPPRHTLGEEESKHCVRVLRLGRGDTLHLTDGRGNLYRCCITDDDPKHCTVRIDDVQSGFGKLPYSLTMAVAPTKNTERFEWFLEKATEVGIDAIVPLGTEHSERRIFRTERGGKVITAAMKQSLKAYRPELRELTPFREEVLRPFPDSASSPTAARRTLPKARRTCRRRCRPERLSRYSSAPKGTSRPRRSTSPWPTDSARSPSATNGCAPRRPP